MRRVLLWMVVGAGCYAPQIQSGSACETTCPGDLECIDQVCREPGYVPGDAEIADVIDGPLGDVDADGIADDLDNCPGISNADQHDEDGDALGDPCDPCPHLAGTAEDSDGDGVGDACDPQPAMPKQRLAFFDPFTSLKPEWGHVNGVSLLGETMRVLGDQSTNAFTQLFVPNGEVRIAAGGTVISIGATQPRSLAIAFGFDEVGAAHHSASFSDLVGTNSSINILKTDGVAYTNLATHTVPGTLPTGAWAMTIDESVTAQRIDLIARLGGTTHKPLTGDTTAAPPLTSSDEITVFARNLDVRFDYFLVIETLP